MKITVTYFGQVRQIVGKESDVGEYDHPIRLCEVLADLAKAYGGDFENIVMDKAGVVRSSLLILLNGEAANNTSPCLLEDGDEVVLLPPIAGG